MGKQENSSKAGKHAEYLKAKGVTRKTGQCPWGCGATYSITGNGQSLLNHLQKCRGGGARRFKSVRT